MDFSDAVIQSLRHGLHHGYGAARLKGYANLAIPTDGIEDTYHRDAIYLEGVRDTLDALAQEGVIHAH